MQLGLEERIGAEIPGSHPLQSWATEYAATPIRPVKIVRDGETAWERMEGRQSHNILPEFGESILYRPLKDNPEDP